MLICPGIHLVVSALNAFWPGALDERQRSDDFLVCEVILIGGHVIWVGFADHLFEISLETPIGDEEDSQLGDFIEDKNAILPLDSAIQENLKETTTRVLSSLTPREERVLRMRFGIGMNTDHTLEEVGQQFSVTRERIRQIEAKALRKLKHPSRSRKLRSFLDE